MYCPGELRIRQMGYDEGGIELYCAVTSDSMPNFGTPAPCGFRREVGYDASLADVHKAAMERPEHPPASTL